MTHQRSLTLNENDAAQPLCDLPVLSGTTGPNVIDVQALYKETGMFTYDPGFNSTASCRSTITFIDGEEGILLYRGYPIEQLAEQCNFLEVCYLILKGDLPNEQEITAFQNNITMHTMVHDQLTNFFKGFRRDAHPMAIMVGVVGALSAFYHDALDIRSKKDREMCAIRLIAKVPTIVAMCHKYSTGMPFMYPDNKFFGLSCPRRCRIL
jgi:citrate synthase